MKIAYLYLTKLIGSRVPADANQTLNMVNAFAQHAEITYFSHWGSKKKFQEIFEFYFLQPNFHLVRIPVQLVTSTLFLEKLARGFYCLFALLYIRLHRYDIIYTRDFSFVYFLSMIPKFMRPKQKVVYEPHNILHVVSPKINIQQEKAGIAMADIFIPTTNGSKEDLIHVFNIDESKMFVQPNAVNIHNFSLQKDTEAEGFLEKYPSLRGYKIVAYTGTFGDWKGVDTLVKSYKFLKSSNVKFLLVGGIGEDRKVIEELIQKEGLKNEILIEGFLPQKELIGVLNNVTIATIPNNEMGEGKKYTSPLKTYEYMAMGLPIIASNLYSMRQLLKNGENCLFFEPENEKDLAKKIDQLLEDETLRQQLINNNYSQAQLYSWEKRAENILGFIESSSKLKAK
ncbi:MAG: glycosyltransferase family 4 protein [Chitinophagales bacterium]